MTEDAAATRRFVKELAGRLVRERVPLCGSIELTRRCNLSCVHCYCRTKVPDTCELDTRTWRALIDEVVGEGCLDLLITGGEPLLRPDFAALYAHAVESGLLVTVFTNGTLVTDAVARLFADLPPQNVEISVYGATVATYGRVSGVPAALEACLSGVRRLVAAGVRVGLKTVLLTENRGELPGMQAIARDLGVGFRFDAAVSPRLDGDPSPLAFRVDPREAVRLELADPEDRLKWREYMERRPLASAQGALYQCGAGLTSFHIDPTGRLLPCLLSREPFFDLRAPGDFRVGWRGVIARLRDRRAEGPALDCGRCGDRSVCAACPAFSSLETGSENGRSDYVCAIARHRRDSLA